MKRLDFGSDHLGPDVFEYLNRPWTGQPRGLFNARFMNLSVKNVSLLFFIVKYRKGDSVVLVEPVLISTQTIYTRISGPLFTETEIKMRKSASSSRVSSILDGIEYNGLALLWFSKQVLIPWKGLFIFSPPPPWIYFYFDFSFVCTRNKITYWWSIRVETLLSNSIILWECYCNPQAF